MSDKLKTEGEFVPVIDPATGLVPASTHFE